MKKIVALVALMAAVCTACTNIKETPKGFQFTVLRAGDGVPVKPQQFLVMNMVFKDGKDSVWNDTRKGDPMIVMIQDSASISREDGIDEVFRMLTKGDSVMCRVQAKSLFEKTFRQTIPKNIDPYSEFTFNMVVNEVYEREQMMKIQQDKFLDEKVKAQEAHNTQLAKDIILIDQYLATNNVNAIRDTTGIRYIITKVGKGKHPVVTDSVTVQYAGRLMDSGQEFDKSTQPVTFGLYRLIKGWQIGFPKLAEGSKATLYIPSGLAYGPKDRQGIPANSNLIFEVELIKIKEKKKTK